MGSSSLPVAWLPVFAAEFITLQFEQGQILSGVPIVSEMTVSSRRGFRSLRRLLPVDLARPIEL
jgi:hypothetical protein